MAKEQELKFPTFECVISNTVEDYDSEVEYFFLIRNYLAADLFELSLLDKAWASNYRKMLDYLEELVNSIVDLKSPPSHDFLVELAMGEELEDYITERLKRSKDPLVAKLIRASTRVREMMYWYVRNGKNAKFASGFNPERFQGLPFLRLVLTYRSIALSKNNK
ncbi:MAG TPA: hypothetical protein VKU79_03710 [Thermoplasmataceae archaeon]|nr:hypothetical protein [Thermoplasmataceae archaeon]